MDVGVVVEPGDVDEVGVGEAEVLEASDMTETVPSPSLATKTSLLPES